MDTDLDLNSWWLVQGEEIIHLRVQSFRVLQYLVEHPAQAIDRDLLLQTIAPDGIGSSSNAVDRCILEIRRVLGDVAKAPLFLETVRGVGYRFIGHVTTMKDGVLRLGPGTGSAPEPPRPLWNLPYYRNPFFTGREPEMQTLFEALHAQHTAALTQPRALCGLGGIGKTQTAVEYAYQYRDQYQAVFWIRAATEVEIRSGFVAIAQLLELPEAEAQDAEEAVLAVQQWLAIHGPWLLVFDNADQREIVQPYLSRSPRGHILLTSRASNFDALGIRDPLYLDTLSREESLLLLFKRTGRCLDDDDSDPQEYAAAMAIVEELGYLPLALEQAGAFIKAHAARFNDYLQSYRYRGVAHMFSSETGIADYPASVLTTWNISFQEIETLAPPAADLLRLSAFLHPDDIPLALIAQSAPELGAPLAEALTDVADDPLVLNHTLEPLLRYSLVRPAATAHTFSIHRLVQAVVYVHLADDERRLWAGRVIRAVCLTFEKATQARDWPLCDLLLPHAEVALRLALQYDFDFQETRRLEQHLVVSLYARLDVQPAQVLHDWREAQHYLTEAYNRFTAYGCTFHAIWSDFEQLQTCFLMGERPYDALAQLLKQVAMQGYDAYLANWLHASSTDDWRVWVAQQSAQAPL